MIAFAQKVVSPISYIIFTTAFYYYIYDQVG